MCNDQHLRSTLLTTFKYVIQQCFVLFCVWPHHAACRILDPPLGIKPMPLAVEEQSPKPWTTREFPHWRVFNWHGIWTEKLSGKCTEQPKPLREATNSSRNLPESQVHFWDSTTWVGILSIYWLKAVQERFSFRMLCGLSQRWTICEKASRSQPEEKQEKPKCKVLL